MPEVLARPLTMTISNSAGEVLATLAATPYPVGGGGIGYVSEPVQFAAAPPLTITVADEAGGVLVTTTRPTAVAVDDTIMVEVRTSAPMTAPLPPASGVPGPGKQFAAGQVRSFVQRG